MAAVLLGVGVLANGDCLHAGSALRSIRGGTYLLLGWLYSLSLALQQSGLAALVALVANSLLAAIQAWPAFGAILAVYSLTKIITELLSNGYLVGLAHVVFAFSSRESAPQSPI